MNYGGNLRNFWELIPPIRCDFPALYKSESCTCLCVQTVETIIEPYPRLDLNCSRTWEPEWAAGFHWYCLRICPWVFCLGWDQQLAVLCLSHTKECSGFGSGVTQVEEALSRSLSSVLQQLMVPWLEGCGCSWAVLAVQHPSVGHVFSVPAAPASSHHPAATGTGTLKDSGNACLCVV